MSEQHTSTDHETATPSVLLIDDDPGIQFGYSRYLGKKGYAVEGVQSLTEAKRTVETETHDIVLLDLRLPDGNGLDWIESLRDKCPDAAIVVITAHDSAGLAAEATRLGADSVLNKPVDMDALDALMRSSTEAVRQRRERTS